MFISIGSYYTIRAQNLRTANEALRVWEAFGACVHKAKRLLSDLHLGM
jgi:hypothetical protein